MATINHKCFISYKKENVEYKDYLIKNISYSAFIDKSLDRKINSYDGDYVMKVIRQDYLSDSTVTIFLIGSHSSENEGRDWFGDKNYFIQRELQASLYSGEGNTMNGILGVVLPEMYDRIYKGSEDCSVCGSKHNLVEINDSTVIREFSQNYYIKPHDGCAWKEEERYCELVKWDDFIKNPDPYIEAAFQKRNSDVAAKVKKRNFR